MAASTSPSTSSASAQLAGMISHQMDEEQLGQLIRTQRQTLSRFEKTNEMLSTCDSLCAARFETAQRDVKAVTATVNQLKTDLDSIFQRIRLFKQATARAYPEEFKEAAQRHLRERRGSSVVEGEATAKAT